MTNPTTAEIRWDLSDLYVGTDDRQIDTDLARARAESDRFQATYRGRVAALSAAELRDALQRFEALLMVTYRPEAYASLAFSADTQDSARQALLTRVEEAGTEIFNNIVFFDIEIKMAPEPVVDGWLAAPVLQNYYHYLRAARLFAPHTLSEAEEQLMAKLNLTGASAWDRLYTEITSSLRFPVEVEGEMKELTDSEVRALRASADRDLRRRATEALAQGYAGQSQVLTFIFNTLYQDHKLKVDLRRYSQAIEPTALENEISSDVIETLMQSCERHYPIAQEYYRLKAKLLGLTEDFRFHDVLAPYMKVEPKYTFEEARDMVLTAYGRFSPAFRALGEEFFRNKWIDVPPAPGKAGRRVLLWYLAGRASIHPDELQRSAGRCLYHCSRARSRRPFLARTAADVAQLRSDDADGRAGERIW